MKCEVFTLDIRTENAAFLDEEDEVDPLLLADALRDIAERLEQGDWYPGHTRSILDYNGNRVGSYRWGNERTD